MKYQVNLRLIFILFPYNKYRKRFIVKNLFFNASNTLFAKKKFLILINFWLHNLVKEKFTS